MARLNQTCVVPVQYLESIVQLRLSQAHRSRCASSDQYNRPFAIRVNSSLRFPHRAFLAVLPNGGRFVPGAILVAVAVGRFANNRSPPTSQWANAVTIQLDPPGPRLWWGQRWRAIHGRGREYGRDPWHYSLSLSRRERSIGFSCGFTPCGCLFAAQTRRRSADRVPLLVS